MPPPPSQKGTGKKGARGSEARRSRSRNTTPAISSETDSAYLDIALKPLRGASYDEIIDQQGSAAIPDSKALEKVMGRVQNIVDQIDTRDDEASKALRKINEKKKERIQEDMENENVRREKLQRDAEEQERARKANKKKKVEASKADRQLTFTHGVHGLAPQDGSNIVVVWLQYTKILGDSRCTVAKRISKIALGSGKSRYLARFNHRELTRQLHDKTISSTSPLQLSPFPTFVRTTNSTMAPKKRKVSGVHQDEPLKVAKADQQTGPASSISRINQQQSSPLTFATLGQDDFSPSKITDLRSRMVFRTPLAEPQNLHSSNVTELRAHSFARTSTPLEEASRAMSQGSDPVAEDAPFLIDPELNMPSMSTLQSLPRKPSFQTPTHREFVSTPPSRHAQRFGPSFSDQPLPSRSLQSLQYPSSFEDTFGSFMPSSSPIQFSPHTFSMHPSNLPALPSIPSRQNIPWDFSNPAFSAPTGPPSWAMPENLAFQTSNDAAFAPVLPQNQQYNTSFPPSNYQATPLEQFPDGFETYTQRVQQSGTFDTYSHHSAALDQYNMGTSYYPPPTAYIGEVSGSRMPFAHTSLPPKPSALRGHALPPKPPLMQSKSKTRPSNRRQNDSSPTVYKFINEFAAPSPPNPPAVPVAPKVIVPPNISGLLGDRYYEDRPGLFIARGPPNYPKTLAPLTAQQPPKMAMRERSSVSKASLANRAAKSSGASQTGKALKVTPTTRMTRASVNRPGTPEINEEEDNAHEEDSTSVHRLTPCKPSRNLLDQQVAAAPRFPEKSKSENLKSQDLSLAMEIRLRFRDFSDADLKKLNEPYSVSNIIPGAATPSPSRKQRDDVADSASSSLSPVEPTTPGLSGALENASGTAKANDDDDDDDDSMDEHQPAPAPMITQLKTFGDDPSTFPDPTIYEIRKVHSGMTEDEIREVCSVAEYPHDDLHSLIPGTPPDKDFSNAKPSNQVQANTFATYLEPFFRPLTEEDEAFLRERGDRTTPFLIPRRGKKHYTEVWADEDGSLSYDIPRQDRDKLPANQARGNIEDMNDDVAETDQVSVGPLLGRLLSLMRPEHRAPPTEPPAPTTNGLTSVDDLNLEMMGADPSEIPPILDQPAAPLAPATYMSESSSDAWKRANPPKLEYPQVDERIKQELRHLGIMPMEDEPDYEGHYDDEIAARLRMLQADLREKSIINGARKARIMDLTLDVMAHQEFRTIQEDLDGQLNVAYMKSTRTMGKNKKNKRPGGAGGGSHGVAGVARPGVRDQTKSLMERRAHWIDTIGPAFKDDPDIGRVPRASEPNSSIFGDDVMGPYVQREREIWEDDGELE